VKYRKIIIPRKNLFVELYQAQILIGFDYGFAVVSRASQLGHQAASPASYAPPIQLTSLSLIYIFPQLIPAGGRFAGLTLETPER
jgi:hypothetical protein